MPPTFPPAVDELVDLARGFCRWCEAATLASPVDVSASIWLAKLHAAALSLPDADSLGEQRSAPPPTLAAARAVSNLASFDGYNYREYIDTDPDSDDEPVVSDIGADLPIIYKDVRAGLALFDAGQVADALSYWAFFHRMRWGRRVVGALVAFQSTRSS